MNSGGLSLTQHNIPTFVHKIYPFSNDRTGQSAGAALDTVTRNVSFSTKTLPSPSSLRGGLIWQVGSKERLAPDPVSLPLHWLSLLRSPTIRILPPRVHLFTGSGSGRVCGEGSRTLRIPSRVIQILPRHIYSLRSSSQFSQLFLE